MPEEVSRSQQSSATTYLVWALGGFVCVALLCVASVLLSLDSRVSTGLWTQQRLSIKRDALSLVDPKLVLLGGSNALYGFSAAQLSTQRGIATVNAGTHAGLGIAFILREGRRSLAPGRVIVLALEYELYADGQYDRALADQVLGFEPAMFWQLDLPAQGYLVFGLPLSERVRYLRAARGMESHHAYADADARQAVNPWGDTIDNDQRARTPAMLAGVQATKPHTYSHGTRAWQQIAAFAADARRSAARVVIAYPNIYYKALGQHNGRFLTELERRASELGIPTIGRPHDYEFGDDRAFNTSYHQSQQGQQLSTERLYRDLAAAGFL